MTPLWYQRPAFGWRRPPYPQPCSFLRAICIQWLIDLQATKAWPPHPNREQLCFCFSALRVVPAEHFSINFTCKFTLGTDHATNSLKQTFALHIWHLPRRALKLIKNGTLCSSHCRDKMGREFVSEISASLSLHNHTFCGLRGINDSSPKKISNHLLCP